MQLKEIKFPNVIHPQPNIREKETGLVDYRGSEADDDLQIRTLVTLLPANNEDDMSYEECTDDLNRVCPDLANCAKDTAIAFSQISDNHLFFEEKQIMQKICFADL